ncbi:hypothetical protein [Paraburkholderia sp. BCC1884]|uniref:hypothetical protein n=1 Tax=Paraburkholderia sp. BCC1884 TaxID=2562668 RepID=UPI0011822FD3|nr:hypothetical protein [Paraburkholderia sp. BCC1884]
MRAHQFLPDDVDHVELQGTTVRKGTVAAFLANARVWSDTGASESARAEAAADLREALPALRAIGLLDVLEIRDPALRAWVVRQ